jgi:chromosome segregation ATPase
LQETPVDADAPADSNGHAVEPKSNGLAPPTVDGEKPDDSDTSAKLEAMSQEREALRAEVEQLRRQLESIQESHASEVTQLKADLEESNAAKESAEEQYQNLLGRVEKIKQTLSDRLRRDKAELEEAKERIEELEAQNEELRNTAVSSGEDVSKLKEDLQDATRELNTLRSRNNLSAQNWNKEKEELVRQVQHLKEEMETTANAMGEWEVIAMEERSIKESLVDKVSELEEQVVALREGYEGANSERDSQATLIDNLQNALREIQEARKRELREMVETTEEQVQGLKKLVQEADARATEAEAAKQSLTQELERTAPFEKEVKEKNLLIGKLRHEAIVLNDHLTKALRYLKKTKPEDNVDRYIACGCVTIRANHEQTNRHQPPPPLPHSRPRRRQALPGPPSHGRLPQLDRRAARASRPRPPWRLQQPPPTHVSLHTNTQLALAQRRRLLGAIIL